MATVAPPSSSASAQETMTYSVPNTQTANVGVQLQAAPVLVNPYYNQAPYPVLPEPVLRPRQWGRDGRSVDLFPLLEHAEHLF